MAETLSPCPFCGGSHLSESAVSNTNGQLRYIWCLDCDAKGPWTQKPKQATEAWNLRANFLGEIRQS